MAESSLLPATWQVPEVFRRRLGSGVGRQRSMQADGHLLLVLHAPPGIDEDTRTGRFFWRDAAGKWTSKDLGTGIQALSRHLDHYSAAIEKLDQQEEQSHTAAEYFAVLEALSPVYRAARHLHLVLQEARKQVPDDRDLINLRDRAYELERAAELLFEGTKNALDYLVAKQAEQHARSSHQMAVSSHRLNLLAGFFLPVATLSSLFGINIKHGFEDNPPPNSFLVFTAVGLALGLVLTVFMTRRRGTA